MRVATVDKTRVPFPFPPFPPPPSLPFLIKIRLGAKGHEWAHVIVLLGDPAVRTLLLPRFFSPLRLQRSAPTCHVNRVSDNAYNVDLIKSHFPRPFFFLFSPFSFLFLCPVCPFPGLRKM